MTPPTIGILAGSGPEAGQDLWSKVLAAQRTALADVYRGDIDAPRVVILSEPELGLSMDLGQHESHVWTVLERAARELASNVDVWAIACNTLNYFAPRLDGLGFAATLITPNQAAVRFLDTLDVDRVGLLGARPVVEMGAFSPYAHLAENFRVDTPPSVERELLHQVIEEIKIDGGARPDHPARLEAIVASLPTETTHVLLACTELPLVTLESSRELIDVTALLAAELVSFR